MSTQETASRPPSRRLDASGPGTADLAGVRLTLGTLVRWSPIVLAAAAIGWVAGSAVPDIGRPSAATVTVGLTGEVVWPFYDAVIARQEPLLDGGVVAAAETTTGVIARDVVVDIDTGQTNAVLRLVVEADDEADARALADAIGTGLVAQNLVEQRSDLQHDIDEITARLTERQSQLDELNEQRDIALFSGDRDEAAQAGEAALVIVNAIAGIEGELTDATSALAALQPRVEVLAPAVVGRNRSDDVRANAVTAALFALLAVAIVPSLDRRLVKVRSSAHLRRIWPGVPVIDPGTRRSLLGDTLDDVILRVGDDGALAVTVLALDPTSAAAVHTDDDPDAPVVVTPSADATWDLIDADAVIVALRRGTVTVKEVEGIADDLAALGVTPRAVVLARR